MDRYLPLSVANERLIGWATTYVKIHFFHLERLTKMGQTIIGVFKTTLAAEQAADQLIRVGVPRNTITLSHQSGSPVSDDALVPEPATNKNGLPPEALLDDTGMGSSGLRTFLSSLFGDDPNKADALTRIAATGSVITVHAPTDPDAKQAIDILTDNGAVDVNARIGTYNLAISPLPVADKVNPGRT